MFDQPPSHPGEIIRDDILPSLGITRTALARQLGISPRRLADLLAERRPVTVDLALRLGTVLGYGPRYWLGMQAQYDIWKVETATPPRLEPITWRRPRPTRAAVPVLARGRAVDAPRPAAG
jgi:addiction module HigA family antidote